MYPGTLKSFVFGKKWCLVLHCAHTPYIINHNEPISSKECLISFFTFNLYFQNIWWIVLDISPRDDLRCCSVSILHVNKDREVFRVLTRVVQSERFVITEAGP